MVPSASIKLKIASLIGRSSSETMDIRNIVFQDDIDFLLRKLDLLLLEAKLFLWVYWEQESDLSKDYWSNFHDYYRKEFIYRKCVRVITKPTIYIVNSKRLHYMSTWEQRQVGHNTLLL